jgi:uncharacterized membrane protein
MASSLSQIQKTILAVYALIAAGSIMMLVPHATVPFAGLACSMVGFLSAYVYRWKNKTDGILQFHMTYIIRTVWWASLILITGLFLFCVVLFNNGDLSMIYNVMSDAEKGLVPTDADMRVMQAEFVRTNVTLITITAAVCLLPYPLYLIIRMFNGVRKVLKQK